MPSSTQALRAKEEGIGEGVVDYMLIYTSAIEFGNEKSQSLEGLTDKQIEDTVSGLVSKA